MPPSLSSPETPTRLDARSFQSLQSLQRRPDPRSCWPLLGVTSPLAHAATFPPGRKGAVSGVHPRSLDDDAPSDGTVRRIEFVARGMAPRADDLGAAAAHEVERVAPRGTEAGRGATSKSQAYNARQEDDQEGEEDEQR